jgi:SMODS-associated NUDIX domain
MPKLVFLLFLLIVGVVWRESSSILTLISVLAGVILTLMVEDFNVSETRLRWPALYCGVRYRKRPVRVSMSYLISIAVDDTYLLVRGRRLTHQFQPVGGVYKTSLSHAELTHRFDATNDVRFAPDAHTVQDLRLRVPGRRIPRFLNWFLSETDRESMPYREFYEELVASSIVDDKIFRVVDFQSMGIRHLPVHIDPHSGAPQLIVAAVYQMRPTFEQEKALRELLQDWHKSLSPEIYFASVQEIEFHGALDKGGVRSDDIAPTARWLIESAKR